MREGRGLSRTGLLVEGIGCIEVFLGFRGPTGRWTIVGQRKGGTALPIELTGPMQPGHLIGWFC